MAKSKSGGTRSYLRGRIANDVYSIGKDSKGAKQQVVRSLAEQVANPQTVSQMRGRMIMSTVMQAVSGLSLLIDHSFDNVPTGQPSISEFIRKNYALIKEDVSAHPTEGNSFGLNKYQEKGAKAGALQVSYGDAAVPGYVAAKGAASEGIGIAKTAAMSTASAVRTMMGMSAEDYLTFVAIKADGACEFFRVHVSTALAADTALTADNIAQLFDIDNPFNLDLTVSLADTEITIAAADTTVVANGIIFTKNVSGVFRHSTTFLSVIGTPAFTAEVALETYPLGSERFLNGGEL